MTTPLPILLAFVSETDCFQGHADFKSLDVHGGRTGSNSSKGVVSLEERDTLQACEPETKRSRGICDPRSLEQEQKPALDVIALDCPGIGGGTFVSLRKSDCLSQDRVSGTGLRILCCRKLSGVYTQSRSSCARRLISSGRQPKADTACTGMPDQLRPSSARCACGKQQGASVAVA